MSVFYIYELFAGFAPGKSPARLAALRLFEEVYTRGTPRVTFITSISRTLMMMLTTLHVLRLAYDNIFAMIIQ
jgi:hypothetical protein